MAFSNNVATQHLVLDHDDETHGSDSVVPDPCILESSVNTDNSSVSGVATLIENMDISRSSNSRDIGVVPTIAVSDLASSETADTFANINDFKKVTKDMNDISNTALTTSDIDDSIDDDNKIIDAADTNNNNEVTRINDILNVTEDNNDISYNATTFDIDGSSEDANSIVDDVANTNNNAISLINASIPNDQSTIESIKTNAPLEIGPTLNGNESPDMPNIIRIVNKPRTNNTIKPFSQAVTSPLPSQEVSSPSLPKEQGSGLPLPVKRESQHNMNQPLLNTQGPRPSLPNIKRSRLPVPIKQVSTPPLAPNEHSSTPSLSNNQGSIPCVHEGSTLFLPDHRTLHCSMIIPQIAVHRHSCCACPSQLIIQPQMLINMETCCICGPQEPFSVPPNITRPNAQFPPPQYPQFNRAPLPYPQLNRAPSPYPPFNRDPLPYHQFNRAPLPYQYSRAPLSYPQFSRAPLPQQGEQMFVPRHGHAEPRFRPPFKSTRQPNMEYWQRNSPRPENLQPMRGNFPNSHNRLPNMGFSRSPASFPSVRPHFQPQNPNGMMNRPPYWQNNIPNAPIYPTSFHGARPRIHRMPPPSFYRRQWFPDDFNRSMASPSRFEGRSPPGFERELESIPEMSEAQEVDDMSDQIKRKKGQLPLYLRKT